MAFRPTPLTSHPIDAMALARPRFSRLRVRCRALLLLLCAAAATPVSYAAEVRDLRLWRAPDHTRLVFDLSGAQYSDFHSFIRSKQNLSRLPFSNHCKCLDLFSFYSIHNRSYRNALLVRSITWFFLPFFRIAQFSSQEISEHSTRRHPSTVQILFLVAR